VHMSQSVSTPVEHDHPYVGLDECLVLLIAEHSTGGTVKCQEVCHERRHATRQTMHAGKRNTVQVALA